METSIHDIGMEALKKRGQLRKTTGRIVIMESENPEKDNSMFLDGPHIPMEIIESQEEDKPVVKVTPKSEVSLTSLAEKEAFYKMAIKTDEKSIVAAKERIKHNKIRLRKLESYLAAEKQRAEKALMDL